MNVFSRKNSTENESWKTVISPEVQTDNDKVEQRAKDITADSKHELRRFLDDPYWIRKTLALNGETAKGKTAERNLKDAIKILNEKKGYSPELIKKVYDILEEKRKQEEQ